MTCLWPSMYATPFRLPPLASTPCVPQAWRRSYGDVSFGSPALSAAALKTSTHRFAPKIGPLSGAMATSTASARGESGSSRAHRFLSMSAVMLSVVAPVVKCFGTSKRSIVSGRRPVSAMSV